MKTVNGEETVYTYNALNQLVSDSETSYEYDLNGNLVRVIGSAQSALYEYNAENGNFTSSYEGTSIKGQITKTSMTFSLDGEKITLNKK